MRLFFTGAKEYLGPQANPRLSLGGLISSSPIPNDAINGLFGSISDLQGAEGSRETRGLVLLNETGGTVSGATLWYVNNSSSPISNLRMAIVSVGIDACNDQFIEKITSSAASPLNASFEDNSGQANAIALPDIDDGEYLGIWIERSVNKNAVKAILNCDNLFNLHTAEPLPQIQTVTTVADSSDSLNDTYWFLNTVNDRFYVWYDTGAGVNPNIAGREGIRVSISTDDTADAVASKTQVRLNNILQARFEADVTVDTNIITITNKENGATLANSAETSGFTMAVSQEGVTKELESIEDIDLFINY